MQKVKVACKVPLTNAARLLKRDHIHMTDSLHEKKQRFSLIKYLKDAFEELGKVTWPTKEQAALLTALVVSVSLFVSIYVGALDLGFSEMYKWLLTTLSSS